MIYLQAKFTVAPLHCGSTSKSGKIKLDTNYELKNLVMAKSSFKSLSYGTDALSKRWWFSEIVQFFSHHHLKRSGNDLLRKSLIIHIPEMHN